MARGAPDVLISLRSSRHSDQSHCGAATEPDPGAATAVNQFDYRRLAVTNALPVVGTFQSRPVVPHHDSPATIVLNADASDSVDHKQSGVL